MDIPPSVFTITDLRGSQAASSQLVELASGVDALYLSGRSVIPRALLESLSLAKAEAVALNCSVPINFGGIETLLEPFPFGRYRYRLTHPYGLIGISPSMNLPALRVQPRAEFLHGVGPRQAVQWFRELLERACGPVLLSANRLDLFADFQGWDIDVDDRRAFLCRAKSRGSFEMDDQFNGLQFGKRSTSTISARLYDKTAEMAAGDGGYLPVVWGGAFDSTKPVLRVEFELQRQALREYGVLQPDEAIDAAGALWASLTEHWLTHRVATNDQTASRWPVSEPWTAVRRARLSAEAHGLDRVYDAKRRGTLEGRMPGLVGYLSSVAALTHCETLDELLPDLTDMVEGYGRTTGRSFEGRVAQKHRDLGIP